MTPEKKARAREIYLAATDVDDDVRDAFVREKCGGDSELLAEVERLLALEKKSSGFLTPATLPVEDIGDARADGELAETVDSGATREASSRLWPLGLTPRFEERGFTPGDAVGPYRIVEEVGAGGMGVVYRAEQEEPIRRRVALKVIKLGMDTREIVARFEAERQALALMDHPNIAKVFDAGITEDGRPYFVMEYLAGVPLNKHCDRARLTTRERLDLFLPICAAVHHAHQKGIIHRDLKPSNILIVEVDGRRTPKIIDFGIAKAISQRLIEHTLSTQRGMLIGTPEYMSPEQAEPTNEDIDTRADIYSLGVVLYELLVGALPISSEELREAGLAGIQRLIWEKEPLSPSTRLSSLQTATESAEKRHTDLASLARQVRGDLDWITLKALEKDRARRYVSVAEFAADIQRHLNDEPVLAGPPSTWYRVQKFVVRRRRALSVTSVVAVLLLLTGWGVWGVFEERAFDARVGRATELLEAGRRARGEYDGLRRSVAEVETRWRTEVERVPEWMPVWERDAELKAWDELVALRTLPDLKYLEGVQRLTEAIETAPPSTAVAADAKRLLESMHFERWRESNTSGSLSVTPDYFRALVDSLQLNTYTNVLEGGETLRFVTDAGVDAFCFRYVEYERRLLPLPFDPAAGRVNPAQGILVRPALILEAVDSTKAGSFQAGDHWVRLDGQPVDLRTDIARRLATVGVDVELTVRVDRNGEDTTLPWIPYPAARNPVERRVPEAAERPGRVVDLWRQFGLRFAGYPLQFLPGCNVGRAAPDGTLTVDLPAGSYLFLFRREGNVDLRFPVRVPAERGMNSEHRVNMLKAEQVPEGFVYVPPGPVAFGDSRETYREPFLQNLVRGVTELEGFFIGRTEVSMPDYLEFLNDPDVNARIDVRGKAKPMSVAVKSILESEENEELYLVPVRPDGKPIFRRLANGQWEFHPSFRGAYPVVAVQYVAALEYAAWKSRKSDRWHFRLPTDLEWEKAARGVDRRRYVWGEYLVWQFCVSLHRFYDDGANLFPVGTYPFDESVYGVRDMNGSASEFTSGLTVPGDSYRSLRGGSWRTEDAYRYRLITRLGRHQSGMPGFDQGFRLVAVPK